MNAFLIVVCIETSVRKIREILCLSRDHIKAMKQGRSSTSAAMLMDI